MPKLPEKTVERLSRYRRTLLTCLLTGKEQIFSHELAALLHITPVQVRRDIMLIGYSGSQSRGYNIRDLIELIASIIDTSEGLNVAVIGLGNLGKAIVNYFKGKRTKLTIVAAFDINEEKINKTYSGIPCYHFDLVKEKIKEHNVSIGIITVTAAEAPNVAEKLVEAGIKGILNFTPRSLNVPETVHLEEYSMITSLEKVAYFVK